MVVCHPGLLGCSGRWREDVRHHFFGEAFGVDPWIVLHCRDLIRYVGCCTRLLFFHITVSNLDFQSERKKPSPVPSDGTLAVRFETVSDDVEVVRKRCGRYVEIDVHGGKGDTTERGPVAR